MTLKDKFRQELTGHLSDEKTEVDVNIAVRIAEEFAIGFAEWCNENYELYHEDGEYYSHIENKWYKVKELLEIYEKEQGL